MHNVMLDLETMGTGPRATIVSIGAVFFDPQTGELGAEFEAHIDLRDSARFGEIDPDTVLWWLRQSDEARKAIAYDQGEGRRVSLSEGVQQFEAWIGENTGSTDMRSFVRPNMWGNGAGFDCTIMASAFAALGLETWNGFQDRDVRTVVDMGCTLCGFDPKQEMPFEGVAHTPLADAKHQARYVSAIYQRLAHPNLMGIDWAARG